MTEPALPEESIFAQALEIASAAERAAFLDRACGNNQALRGEVEALLRAHEQSGDLLDLPEKSPVTTDLPGQEHPGTFLGPYKLLEQIGEGGMGIVWMAEQTEPIQRRVAVKVVKEGMDSRQVLARFEAERQALALMEHPNIAKVLDAGQTPLGRPFFVMELVKGQPITKYCDEKRLAVRERLELFADVCRAVQHAHQKGIIHRDLKPSNVLVAPYDGRPVVKVIDFGVAKATGQRLTDKTLFTGFGALVGTPEYMSPEQAEVNNQDIDTRSDIYSLGVILYELLTGSTPLTRKRLKEVALLEVLRVIREEEPPRPSTRLLESKDTLPSISAQRQTEPGKLTKLVRGELDWMVMKALEKDRNRRYETANGFAMDVQRFLADEPVLACPPSALYRLRKFARRNKTALRVGCLILFFVLLLGAVGGWVAFDRGARRTKAVQDLDLALQRTELHLGQEKWADARAGLEQAERLAVEARPDPDRNERLIDLRERLEAAERDQQFSAGYEDILLGVQSQIDVVNSRMTLKAIFPAIRQLFSQYGMPWVDTPLEKVAARINSRSEPVRHQLIAALYLAGAHVPAEETRIQEWLVELMKSADTDPWRKRIRQTVATKDWQAMEQLLREVDLATQPPSILIQFTEIVTAQRKESQLDMLHRIQRAYPDDLWANSSLAWELVQRGRESEAVRYYMACLALRPKNPGTWVNCGCCLDSMKETAAAIPYYERAVALSPHYFAAYLNLANALETLGKLQDALAVDNKAVEMCPSRVGAWSNRARLYNKLGAPKKALADCNKAIELDAKLAAAWANRGEAYKLLGQYEKAIADCTKAIELDKNIANGWATRGNCYYQRGEYQNALADCNRAIERLPTNAFAWRTRGYVWLALGDHEKAIADCRKAVELAPKDPWTHGCLGDVLLNANRTQEAIASYRNALALDKNLPEVQGGLATALQKQGDFREALKVMRRAHELPSPRPDWAPNSAQWVRQLERLVELDERLPDCLTGKTKPASPEEGVELAELCIRKQLYHAAVRFYDAAFTPISPRTAPLIGAYRYNAACAAALAGCGQGKDAGKLDAKEREQLRRQALDWMRGSLESVGRLLDKTPAKAPDLTNALKHWLADPDFVGVREPQALAKLPEAERQAWQKLWKDISEMLKRVQQKAATETKSGPK
jgi:tetratricopeptide (TPR) repeat protein